MGEGFEGQRFRFLIDNAKENFDQGLDVRLMKIRDERNIICSKSPFQFFPIFHILKQLIAFGLPLFLKR